MVNRLLRKYGEDIRVKKRTVSVDSEGRATYTYPETIEARVAFIPVSAIQEFWYPIGVAKDIDFIVLSRTKDSVSVVGNIFIRPDETEYEVSQSIPRGLGKSRDFDESLVRRTLA